MNVILLLLALGLACAMIGTLISAVTFTGGEGLEHPALMYGVGAMVALVLAVVVS